jgi:hypothetical protein
MSRDPMQPHSIVGGDIIQRLLALLNNWRRYSGGLNGVLSRLAVRANAHLLLWSTFHDNRGASYMHIYVTKHGKPVKVLTVITEHSIFFRNISEVSTNV